MANAEHLALLRQGVNAWNEWRANSNNYEILVDLAGANLSGINLSYANLSRANLTRADLSGANLSNVNLRMANLTEVNFTDADLTGADLKMANLRMAILTRAKLSAANLAGAYLTLANVNQANFSEANLSGVNLRMAYLGEANLNGANLNEANLSGTILEKTQALNTNFNKAVLTGACIQDWNIDSATTLYNVICDYVYLKPNQQERRPSSGNFSTGEFFMMFRKAPEPVDAIVHDEASTARVYQIDGDRQNDTPQQNSVETRVPEKVDRIGSDRTDRELQRTTLQKDTIEVIVPKEVSRVQVARTSSELHRSTSPQNVSEVGTQVNQLLQSGQVYPTTTPIEKLIVVLEVIRRIESNPSLKTRVVNALREVGPDVFRELIDSPLANIFLASVEEWYSGN